MKTQWLVIVAAIVLGVLIYALIRGIAVRSDFTSAVGRQNDSAKADVEFDENSTADPLEQWTQRVEEASRKMQAAQKSGDSQAQSEALKQMVGATLGGGDPVESLAPERIEPFLPETLGGLSRSSFATRRDSAMGLQMTEATATYLDDAGRTLDLKITDTGSAKGLLAFAGWAGVEGGRETGTGHERTYREEGRLIQERWDQSSHSGDYTVIVGDRFTVRVSGSGASIEDLKAAAADLELAQLEALKDEGLKD